jgi:hypothetical protein
MNIEKNINVYIHRRKTDGSIFYVGQGKGNRYKSKKDRNKIWKKIVSEHDFYYELLIENVTRLEASELEKKYIKEYGIENLCNMTLGGLGGDVISFNVDREEIMLKQKRNTPRGHKNPNFGGKLHTDEYLKKQSVSNSKVHLRCENIITGEIITAINSKELGLKINVKSSNVRSSKNKYLVKKTYVITDIILEK